MASKFFSLAVMTRLPSFIMHVAFLITGQQRVNFPLYVANGSIYGGSTGPAERYILKVSGIKSNLINSDTLQTLHHIY